jgi:hypothetical protein
LNGRERKGGEGRCQDMAVEEEKKKKEEEEQQ